MRFFLMLQFLAGIIFLLDLVSKHYTDVLSYQKIYRWFPTDPYYGVDSKNGHYLWNTLLFHFLNCNRRNKCRYES